ncbi:CDC45 family [Lineolata rhizophorae]|uniref:CDC45 family n=1 Tax=Lineolata rhizophorae TaxID=578093 RepID=A0A6A6P3P9_9PEZI|nr:CDC45 family [Lineolata rhizophorae]
MYVPRGLLGHLYTHLQGTHHALSPPVLILVSLEPDALCACRIFAALLKRDYIPHKIQPVSGYGELQRIGQELVRPMRTSAGGSGGVVVCLGVGGLVDLEAMLGLEIEDEGTNGMSGIDVWVFDARRPWNLSNVFGSQGLATELQGDGAERRSRAMGLEKGRINQNYRPGRGGIFVFDDGDIEEEMAAEREAYCELEVMPEVGDDADFDDEDQPGSDRGDDDGAPILGQTRKRKSPSDEDTESEDEAGRRPRQRRRSNLSSPIPATPETRPARRGLLVTDGNSSNFSRSGSPHSGGSLSPLRQHHAFVQPTARSLRRQLVTLRRKHEAVLQSYYNLGTSYSEPISSMLYSLASELGREDNDVLWLAIIGVSSLELYGRTMTGVSLVPLPEPGASGWNGDRGERVRALLRDEVHRLNPLDASDLLRERVAGDSQGAITTKARSPTDTAIRLSPEPRFLLIRHWSLYESMLHSPYLSARLRVWSESGKRRLHKLLAKMGVSLAQCKLSYTHMDVELKRGLRERLLKFAPVYGLDALVPPAGRGGSKDGWGFVRCWGWKACLSAIDVGVILGAILEVGSGHGPDSSTAAKPDTLACRSSSRNNNSFFDEPPADALLDPEEEADRAAALHAENVTARFWTAYDSLGSIDALTSHIHTAQNLHRAILRTGAALLDKRQIRHLRSFRMAVVRDGPDVALFAHPGALVKLALWLAEAVAEQDGRRGSSGGAELVVAGLDESKGVYVVVGLGGGGAAAEARRAREKKRAEKRKARENRKEEKKAEKERRRRERRDRLDAAGLGSDDEDETEDEDSEDSESDDSDSDDDLDASRRKRRGEGRNRFGNAFQEVVEETGSRVRIDSFEHCVVEVKREDLSGFLENLSLKTVVG